ncbi:phage portal protein [Methylobacterium oryzisoli]|uniref:phage portal protein n=1 Tax=Methylobacterium oryzisoli TaxID=3385502 RepID=UPI003891F9F7
MLEPTLLDRAIGYISPERAEKRVAARQRMTRAATTRNLYEAATLGRRAQGWRRVSSDANTEIRIASRLLRDNARDMVRNNAFAQRAKSTIAHNVVGAGILPQVKSDREPRTKQIGDLLRKHFDSTDIDAEGRHNLYGLQSLAMATVVEAGEVLIRRRVRRPSDGFALPFQLQVLEPDYLDTSRDGILDNGNAVVQGVEFNLIGQRVAYYLYDRHPGSIFGNGALVSTGRRVSADFVAHIYRVDRPGQVRGVSWFAPVMTRMRDYADYVDAQLMRQKIASCFAAFITSNDEFNGVEGVGGDGTIMPNDGSSPYPIESFEPGMIERLRDGESVSFATPPTTQDFGPYATETLREIAAGLNIPYEALTGNLSQVNYSSGRMGWLEYQRSIDSWRWNMLIPQMLGPIEAWTLEAANVVTGSSEPFGLDWTPPRREMIDPVVEVEAAAAAIRNGLSWRSEELRKLGYDPNDWLKGIVEDNEIADKFGLILDSDPRNTTLRGASQADKDAKTPKLPQ